jgi:hypothetical protein
MMGVFFEGKLTSPIYEWERIQVTLFSIGGYRSLVQ